MGKFLDRLANGKVSDEQLIETFLLDELDVLDEEVLREIYGVSEGERARTEVSKAGGAVRAALVERGIISRERIVLFGHMVRRVGRKMKEGGYFGKERRG